MIFEIYSKYRRNHSQDIVSYGSPQKADQQAANCDRYSFNSKTKELQSYHVPQFHYNKHQLLRSLHQVTHKVQESQKKNTHLATQILFSHGKYETRKFLHRTREVFGIRDTKNNRHKPCSTAHNSPNNKSRFKSQHHQNTERNTDTGIITDYEALKPDFRTKRKRQSTQIRQIRRQTLGITEAELVNYQNKRIGLKELRKRKQQKAKPKDFRKLNMKGFAAKISASLESKQKVSTKTLARLMNLNIKCIGEGTLRKRCA